MVLRARILVFPVLRLWKFQGRSPVRPDSTARSMLCEQRFYTSSGTAGFAKIHFAKLQSCTKLLGLTATMIPRRFSSTFTFRKNPAEAITLLANNRFPQISLPQG
jgi:hypothetical protein